MLTMALKMICLFLLGMLNAEHAAADSEEATKLGEAMATVKKFAAAPLMTRPVNPVSDGATFAAASDATDATAGERFPSKGLSDQSLQSTMVKTVPDLEYRKHEIKIQYPSLRARIQKFPLSDVQASTSAPTSFGWLATLIASVGLGLTASVAAVRAYTGQQQGSEATTVSQITLVPQVPQRAGPIVAKDHTDQIVENLQRIALFIDGDRIGPNHFKPLINAASQRGFLSTKRAYLSEYQRSLWASELNTCSIEPIVVPRLLGGGKDPVDIEIAYDAGSLARGLAKDAADAVAIASNDIDLALVLRKAHQRGLSAYWLLCADWIDPRRAGFAKDNGIEVLLYKPVHTRGGPKIVVTLESGCSKITYHDGPVRAEGLDAKRTKVLTEALIELKYLPEDGSGSLALALPKFFHANKLGPLIVYPLALGVARAHEIITSHALSSFIPNNGKLIYIEPLGPTARGTKLWKTAGSNHAARVVGGGAPFLLEPSDNIVVTILERLGYIKRFGNLEEAVKRFVKTNSTALLKQGGDLESLKVATTEKQIEGLRDLFLSQRFRQTWKTPRSEQRISQYQPTSRK